MTEWETRNGKGAPFNENASRITRPVAVVRFRSDEELEIVRCNFCHGAFGVDETYLETVSIYVHCPMCCMEIGILTPRPDMEVSGDIPIEVGNENS